MNESYNKKVIGEIKDIITYEDGRVVETEWGRNLVVNSFNLLIAGLLKGDVTQGIKYWAIGSGLSSWDSVPVPPVESDLGCKTEIYRKAIPSGAMSYVDADGNTTAYPTNRLQIALFFDKTEAVGRWREFAIFGGNGASASANTGLALNHRVHGMIDKTANMTIERVLRFTFI